MSEQKKILPAVALRGMTVMPEMVVHFDISRERSVKAVQEAMLNDQTVFLVTQKKIDTDTPDQEELYSVGIIAKVKQVLKMPKNVLRVLVTGEQRARLVKLEQTEPYLTAEITPLEDYVPDLGSPVNIEGMIRGLKDLFMEYAKESYLYHFFAVMLQTGMRKGEMQGLKYSDIDKKQNVIHVQRTLKYIEGQGYIEDTPKTRTSTRDIPLTAAVVEHIEAQRKYWNFKIVNMNQYLFCNEEGGPISRERIQAEIDRTVKRIREAGHDFPRITSHVFRHTFATRAIEAGMPPQVLKTILGHSSLAMTMDLYSHVLPDTKAEEMQKIAIMF